MVFPAQYTASVCLFHLVSLSVLYPKLDWDDPRRMRDRRSGLPALIGSAVYSFLVIILSTITYIMAYNAATWGIPIVIMGLAVMASVTWFFAHWSTTRVEKAWPRIGTV
jgi:hypothetical protein